MNRMRLSAAVRVPEGYREVVVQFLRDWWERRTWELRTQWGMEFEARETLHSDEDFLRCLGAESIVKMTWAAAGETETEGLARDEVYDGIHILMERLFCPPGGTECAIPQAFWETPFGGMVGAAFAWAMGGELISISEAAEISGKSVKSISQLVARGRLQGFPDAREPNPQRRVRVLRGEVERL